MKCTSESFIYFRDLTVELDNPVLSVLPTGVKLLIRKREKPQQHSIPINYN